MKPLSKDEILKLPASDLRLSAIEWLTDGGLRLTLVMPTPERRVAQLTCSFAHELKMDLQFPKQFGGQPLTWDVTFTELPTKEWRALLDFAQKGSIEFICTNLNWEIV